VWDKSAKEPTGYGVNLWSSPQTPGRYCPYSAPGDRLWVRETWTPADRLIDGYVRDDPTIVGYRADGAVLLWEGIGLGGVTSPQALTGWGSEDLEGIRWRPSIFMPRWASRITLEITDVRVEQLQDISEEDAKSEGINCYQFYPDDGWPLCNGYTHVPDDGECGLHDTAVSAFRKLWESINRENTWSLNPWVWVVEFKRIEK